MPIKKIDMIFFKPNFEEKYPWATIPKKAPILMIKLMRLFISSDDLDAFILSKLNNMVKKADYEP